jgi:hypothetical protein
MLFQNHDGVLKLSRVVREKSNDNLGTGEE